MTDRCASGDGTASVDDVLQSQGSSSSFPEVALVPWQEDTLLQQAASAFVQQAKHVLGIDSLGKQVSSWPRQLRLGTACSGTGAAEEALLHFVDALTEDEDTGVFARQLELKVGFMAESKKFKQEFLKSCHRRSFEEGCHLFADVSEDPMRCVAHGHQASACDTTRDNGDDIDVFCAGFSCKSFSAMNVHSASSTTLLNQPTPEQIEKSCSLKTYNGAMRIIARCKPAVVIMENVEHIAASPSKSADGTLPQPTNMDKVLNDLRSHGYAADAVRVESPRFGVPQRRVRYYFRGLHTQKVRNAESQLDTSKELLEQFELSCKPAIDYLLPNNHEIVLAELQGRQGRQRTDSSKESKWQIQHMQAAERLGLTWPLQTPSSMEGPWLETLTQREREVVIFAISANSEVEFIDTSQILERQIKLLLCRFAISNSDFQPEGCI